MSLAFDILGEEPALRQAREAQAIMLQGEHAWLDRRGALYLPEHRLLAVSDLHLEKGAAFARRGVFLPPYDTGATLEKLAGLIEFYRPRAVVSLGDSFHDGEGAACMPDRFRAPLASLMAGRDWFWISGNHDPNAPENLPGETLAALHVGGLTFRHEPTPGLIEGEVAGHLHPCAKIVARGRGVRRRCFASDGSRLIMPAFGAFTGSLNVLDRAFSGLFRREGFYAHMMGSARVFPIPRANLVPG